MRFVDWYQKSPDDDEAGTHDWSLTLKHGRISFVSFCGFCFYVSNSINFFKETNDTLECHRDISKIGNILKRRRRHHHPPPTVFKKKIERKLRDFCCWGEWTHEMRSGRGPLSARKGGGEKENGKDVLLFIYFLFCFCYIVSYIFFYKFVAFVVVVVVVLYDIILFLFFGFFLLSPSL